MWTASGGRTNSSRPGRDLSLFWGGPPNCAEFSADGREAAARFRCLAKRARIPPGRRALPPASHLVVRFAQKKRKTRLRGRSLGQGGRRSEALSSRIEIRFRLRTGCVQVDASVIAWADTKRRKKKGCKGALGAVSSSDEKENHQSGVRLLEILHEISGECRTEKWS